MMVIQILCLYTVSLKKTCITRLHKLKKFFSSNTSKAGQNFFLSRTNTLLTWICLAVLVMAFHLINLWDYNRYSSINANDYVLVVFIYE